jgi:hypothetical protein
VHGQEWHTKRAAGPRGCRGVPCERCLGSRNGSPSDACLWEEDPRPRALGKFVFVGGEKLYLRGVTYGTFRPDADGCDYPPDDVVESDFAMMAVNGVNTVRTYTVPPPRVLDSARRHGLGVLVGIPWEQHVAFLSDRRRMASIEERVHASVRACSRPRNASTAAALRKLRDRRR